MTDQPTIPDTAVQAYDRAYEAATHYHAPDEMVEGNPLGIRAGLAAAAKVRDPQVAAQALNGAYWKLREHASSYRSTEAFRRRMEAYELDRSDPIACRKALTHEFYARGIEAAARTVADLLGVVEHEMEPPADEMERTVDHQHDPIECGCELKPEDAPGHPVRRTTQGGTP